MKDKNIIDKCDLIGGESTYIETFFRSYVKSTDTICCTEIERDKKRRVTKAWM